MSNQANKPQVEANVDVLKVARATSKRGDEQWEISVQLPWSDYPNRFWVNKDQFASEPVIGKHRAILERGSLRKDKDGNYHDGSKDYHYKFKLLKLDDVTVATPSGDYRFLNGSSSSAGSTGNVKHSPTPDSPDSCQGSTEVQAMAKLAHDAIVAGLVRVLESDDIEPLVDTFRDLTIGYLSALQDAKASLRPPGPNPEDRTGKASVESLARLNQLRQTLDISVDAVKAEARERFGKEITDLDEEGVIALRAWMSTIAHQAAEVKATLEGLPW